MGGGAGGGGGKWGVNLKTILIYSSLLGSE